MSEKTLSQQLAYYLTQLRFEQLPAQVIDAARLHILDSLGCLLAGSRLEPGALAYHLAVAQRGSNAASMLAGTSLRVSYLDAVQAMATAAHCGELDDIHGGTATCVGAMVVPALMAIAERYGGSGRRLIEAAIAGYETTARVGLSIDAPKLLRSGWWPSTVCGGFGVAAAGAKFLDWPADKVANALGVAALHAGGMLTGGAEGSTARHVAFGRAAQNGLVALLATEQGLSGPRRGFEDPRGFCLTLCAEPRWEFLQSFDDYFLPRVAFKPYPCARQLHAGVEALLKLIARYSISGEAIRGIELCLPTQIAGMVDRPAAPTLRAATLGSGQYVMAVTALRGKIDLASFEEEFLRNEQVGRLMTMVKVSGSAALDRHFPKVWPGRVTLKLSGGQTHSQEVVAPKGESENPMTREDIEEKFFALAAPVIGEAKTKIVIEEVESLAKRDAMGPLLEALITSV